MPSTKPSSLYSLHPKHKPLKQSNNNNNTNQACAACKYQRRKCASDCLLAPYFPHDRHSQFLNAHKLFGVSNITKIIKHLSPIQRDAAMYTIMFESDARANDPVQGCYSIVRKLHHEIENTRIELEIVLQQLAMFRDQETHIHMQEPQDLSSSCDLNNNNSNTVPYEQYCSYGNFNGLQEGDMWCLLLQDSSTIVNVKDGFIDECEKVKVVEDVSSERHDLLEHHEGYVEQKKLDLPSSQFIISS